MNGRLKTLCLGRVMRVLASAHIFAEVGENHFANNRMSACLVANEPFRAYIVAQ